MKRVILCGVIILTCWAFWGCDTTSTTTVSTTSLILLDRGTVAQDETIYIEAGTDGNAETMILVSRIPQATRGTYDQYGSFTAAQNLSGREPLLVENGQLRIPVASEGTDFYYRATLAEGYEPPFLLAFTYRKNGMVIDPADEKGNAGLFSIEIRVRPNPAAVAEFRDRFLCQLQVTVPAADTTITEAAGGTVVLTGGSFTTGFMTLPGSSATYSLSWETTDFSIRSIQATFTPFSPEVLGSDLSGFGTDLQVLTLGMTSIRDGQMELKTGIETLSTALSSLSSGSTEISGGLTSLAEGLGTLVDSAELMAAQMTMIATAADQLKTGGASLLEGYGGLMNSVNDVVGTFSALHPDDVGLQTKLLILSQTAQAMESALAEYVEGVSGVAEGIAALSIGMQSLVEALTSVETSLSVLVNEENNIASGLTELNLAWTQLPVAIQTMIEAQNQIIAGLNASMENLGFLFSEPSPLVSFVSSANPTPNSVQFVYSIRGF